MPSVCVTQLNKQGNYAVFYTLCYIVVFPPSQEIPPYETKGVMRASFSSREADNHTAFIRIKTNASDSTEFIILPVEVEVTTGQWRAAGI